MVIGIIILFLGASFPVLNADIKNLYCYSQNSVTVKFLIDGSGFLSIEFDGKLYKHNQTIKVNIDEYSLYGGIYVRGTIFDGWTISSDITVEDSNSCNTHYCVS